MKLAPIGFGRKDLYHLQFNPEQVSDGVVWAKAPGADSNTQQGLGLIDAAYEIGSTLASEHLTQKLALLDEGSQFRLAALVRSTGRTPSADVLILSGDHYDEAGPTKSDETGRDAERNRAWMQEEATDWGDVHVEPELTQQGDTYAFGFTYAVGTPVNAEL